MLFLCPPAGFPAAGKGNSYGTLMGKNQKGRHYRNCVPPPSRFPNPDQRTVSKTAIQSKFHHFQSLMGVWELGTYMQETQKSRPRWWTAFWQQNSPFEMDFSLTGIPILPVNRLQKFLRLDMTSRDQGTLSGCADPKLYRLTRREFILM